MKKRGNFLQYLFISVLISTWPTCLPFLLWITHVLSTHFSTGLSTWLLMLDVDGFNIRIGKILAVNKIKKRYQKSKAFWYRWYSIGILLVQHRNTKGAA